MKMRERRRRQWAGLKRHRWIVPYFKRDRECGRQLDAVLRNMQAEIDKVFYLPANDSLDWYRALRGGFDLGAPGGDVSMVRTMRLIQGNIVDFGVTILRRSMEDGLLKVEAIDPTAYYREPDPDEPRLERVDPTLPYVDPRRPE